MNAAGAAAAGAWTFDNPVQVRFGPGCRRELVARLAGRRLLVVTSPAGRRRFEADAMLAPLAGAAIWADRVAPNPGLADTQAEIARLAGAPVDAVLAFGGGSAMDAAKAIAAGLAPGLVTRDLAALIAGPELCLAHPPLPVHAVPTTSGTGAEVTPFATIWDHERRRKLSLAGPGLYPASATIDPDLTAGLPEGDTISTGLDALNQAFESVWNRNRSPVTQLLAGRAIALALEALPRLHKDRSDAGARAMMAEASLLAGLCISQTRTAICHAMSYPLTAHFGLAHGLACAFSMAAVARLVLREMPGPLAEVAVTTGAGDAATLVARLERVLGEVGLESRLGPIAGARARILALGSEMVTPGRSDNFVLPVDAALLRGILAAALPPEGAA